MFTQADKALVAVIMGALYLIKTYFGLDFGVSEATAGAIASFVTAILVYLVPNRKPPT
jgi:hypothetical protein